MRLVIDTSAIIAVIGNEPEKPLLIAATADAELVAPPSVHWEIGNALVTGIRKRRFTAESASIALAAYDKIPLRFETVGLEDAVNLADRLSIYAYDAYVLACAQTLSCPLVTLDQSMTRAARELGIDVAEV